MRVRTKRSSPHTANQPETPDVTMPTTIGTARPSGIPSAASPAHLQQHRSRRHGDAHQEAEADRGVAVETAPTAPR